MSRGTRMRNLALLGGLGAAAMMAGKGEKQAEKAGEKSTEKAVGPQEYKDIKGMDVVDETGMKSRFKRNPETGDLYDPEGGGTKPAARPAAKAAPAKNEPTRSAPAKPAAKATSPRVTDTGDESERLLRRYPSPVPRTDLMKTSPGKVSLGAARFKSGGSVKSSASKRADGIATKGKTRGRVI